MDFVLGLLAEIVFWSFFSLVTLSETMRIRSRNIFGKRIRSQNDSEDRFDTKRIKGDCSAGDEINTSIGNDSDDLVEITRVNSDSDECKVSIPNVELLGRISFGGRGDKKRNSLREIRKQQRSMKAKYFEHPDNLLYYIFYKKITEKYYRSLQQC